MQFACTAILQNMFHVFGSKCKQSYHVAENVERSK